MMAFNLYKKERIIIKCLIFIFYFSSEIKNILCSACQQSYTISNSDCFNNLVFFNKKNYGFGQFAGNNNKDMIIEYSKDCSRLFYGLKKNGTYFFGDENHTKIIETMDSVGN